MAGVTTNPIISKIVTASFSPVKLSENAQQIKIINTQIADVYAQLSALTQTQEDIMTALKTPATVIPDPVDAQTITGAATTAAAPLPVPAANKNSETYSRTLSSAALTDFAYSANQAGRIIEQGFNNSATSTFPYTVTSQSGESFQTPDLGTVTSFTLQNGETRTFRNLNSTTWIEV